MISTLFVLVCSSLNVVCSPEDLRSLLQHKKQHVVTLFVTSKLHVLLFWNANKLNYWFWDTWNDAVLLFSSQKLIQYFTHNASPPKYWVYLDDCDRSLMTLCSEEAVTTRVHFFTHFFIDQITKHGYFLIYVTKRATRASPVCMKGKGYNFSTFRFQQEKCVVTHTGVDRCPNCEDNSQCFKNLQQLQHFLFEIFLIFFLTVGENEWNCPSINSVLLAAHVAAHRSIRTWLLGSGFHGFLPSRSSRVRNRLFSRSTQPNISQAGSLWDHSACQGCCSYLSLPVKAQALAPLHPPRPAERVHCPCGMHVCYHGSGHSGVCVCVCVSACPSSCVPACVLKGQGAPLASRASLQAMPWARKLKTSSRGGNCVCESVCVQLWIFTCKIPCVFVSSCSE